MQGDQTLSVQSYFHPKKPKKNSIEGDFNPKKSIEGDFHQKKQKTIEGDQFCGDADRTCLRHQPCRRLNGKVHQNAPKIIPLFGQIGKN